MKFSSLAVLEVVKITFGAASDKNFINMAFQFRYRWKTPIWQKHKMQMQFYDNSNSSALLSLSVAMTQAYGI